MKKIISFLLVTTLLLTGCTSNFSDTDKIAKALTSTEVRETIVDEAIDKLEYGSILTDDLITYYGKVVENIENTDLEDGSLTDIQKAYYPAIAEVYTTIIDEKKASEDNFKASFAGQKNPEDEGVFGIYILQKETDWNFSDELLNTINTTPKDVAYDYVYQYKNILILTISFYTDDVEAHHVVIDKVVKETIPND